MFRGQVGGVENEQEEGPSGTVGNHSSLGPAFAALTLGDLGSRPDSGIKGLSSLRKVAFLLWAFPFLHGALSSVVSRPFSALLAHAWRNYRVFSAVCGYRRDSQLCANYPV